jgi:CcmD family protein
VSQGQYVAAAYGAVFVVVLVYVAIIAAKLTRIQRQLVEVLELAERRRPRVVEAKAVAQPAAGNAS